MGRDTPRLRQYVRHADLPGLSDNDVKVELDENVLTIFGERRTQHEERTDGYYRTPKLDLTVEAEDLAPGPRNPPRRGNQTILPRSPGGRCAPSTGATRNEEPDF